MYRIVDTCFWNDDKVIDVFSVEDRYFMLYLLTNPHTKQLGIYKLNLRKCAFELGYSKESVTVLVERFEGYGIIKYDIDTQEIAIKNFLKYSLKSGGKPILDCIKKDLETIDSVKLIVFIRNAIKNFKSKKTYESIREMIDLHLINNNNNNNNNNNKESYNDSSNDSSNESYNKCQSSSSQNCFNFYNKNIGPIPPFVAEEIGHFLDDGVEDTLIKKALQIAVEKNIRNWGYAKTIIKNKVEQNIFTLKDFEASELNRKVKPPIKQEDDDDFLKDVIEELERKGELRDY